MSDNVPNYPHFSTSVYMPSGIRVFFTVPIEDWTTAYEGAKEFTDMLLAKGALLHEPGLEAGEERAVIGWVCRRASRDGTPLIDLYAADSRLMFPFIKVYVDSQERINEFNNATGIDFNKLPIYEGDSHIERGANADKDKKYVIPVRSKSFAVKSKNPRYNPDEPDLTKRKPQYLFQRYESVPQSPTSAPKKPATASPASTQAQPAQENAQPGDTREFELKGFQTRFDNSNKPYFALEAVDGTWIYTFSRDLFRALGYPDTQTEAWKARGFKMAFPKTISAIWKQVEGKADGYWNAVVPTAASETVF